MSGSIFYRKRENGDYVECRNPSSNFGKLLKSYGLEYVQRFLLTYNLYFFS